MANQQLIAYVKRSLAAGQSPLRIRSDLTKKGWSPIEIDEAFSPNALPTEEKSPPLSKKPLIGAMISFFLVIVIIAVVLPNALHRPILSGIEPQGTVDQSQPGSSTQSHLACSNLACRLVSGSGADECTNDQDCSHLECAGDICQPVLGKGTNRCLSNSDCTSPTHLECVNQVCLVVSGQGISVCQTTADCVFVPQSHLACVSQSCQSITGSGTDSCQTDADCESPIQTHFECVSFTCQSVSGAGFDLCTTDADCNGTQSHLACVNLACQTVSGAGSDLCQTDADCNVTQTHLECVNLACQTVSGAGADLCQTNADCNLTHLACVGSTCTTVSGAGTNSCTTNADCQTNDSTPPNITITNPLNLSLVNGTITVSATASDNIGVASVQFFLDGANLGSLITVPPYQISWNTSTVPDGTHVLGARAKDAAQNQKNATTVTVIVNNSLLGTSLNFASYLGGNLEDQIRDIFIDTNGNIYVAGGTASSNFPTTVGAYDRTFNGVYDIFVAKFASNGSLIFSTFLGGVNYDRAYAIEVDAQGYIYLAGRAGDGFPTTPGVVQPNFGGDVNPSGHYGPQDGFVTKMSPDGSSVVWSTYFGSDDNGIIRDVDIDAAGNVYVVGEASRSHYAVTVGSFDTTLSGPTDGIIAEISADGTHIVWGAYVGGSSTDGGTPSVRVGDDGTAWMLLHTQSDDFPVTAGAYQTTRGGGVDLAVVKISPGGATKQWASYFGGTNTEFTETHGLWVDANNIVTVSATTTSSNLPPVPVSIPPSFQPNYGGTGGSGSGQGTNYPGDAFIAKFAANGSTLTAFTYLGGSAGEGAEGVALDAQGRVYLSGATYSSNFPISSDAAKKTKSGSADVFLAQLSSSLSSLEYGTFYGGSNDDYGRSMAISSDGKAVSVGLTYSSNFPTTVGSFQPSYGGNPFDAFMFGIKNL